jgi:hypothetical protein
MLFSLLRSLRARCTLAVWLMSAGCAGDVASPMPLAASYKLSLYDGAVLPVTLRNIVTILPAGGAGLTCAERLVNATLSIDALSKAIVTDTLRTSCDDGRPDATRTLSRVGTASTVGDTTRFDYLANGTSVSSRSFARRSGAGLLIFRTETDQRLITSPGSPPATTVEYDFTPRLYVPNP